MKLEGVWTNYHSGNCPLPNDMSIIRLAAGPLGRVWMNVIHQEMRVDEGRIIGEGRTYGLLLFQQGKWELFRMGERGLPQLTVYEMVCDSQGAVWLYMPPNTICRFDGSKAEVFNSGEFGLPDELGLVSSFVIDQNNHLWATLLSQGVYSFDGHLWKKFRPDEKMLAQIAALSVDRSGKKWLAIQNENDTSLLAYDNEMEERDQVPIGYNQAQIQAFLIDRSSNMWLGWGEPIRGTNLGLWVLNSVNQTWRKNTTKTSALSDNNILSLAEDRSGRIWAGAGAGFTIFQESDSVLWEAIIPDTRQGPLVVDKRDKFAAHTDMNHIRIGNHCAADSDGRIWVTSENGVAVFSELSI